MKITKAEAILNHRKLWRWIAKQTRKLKRKVEQSEYFDHYNISYKYRPFCDSYACHYDTQFGDDCTHCPINWGDGTCGTIGLPLSEWIDCDPDDWERAAELADKIAELPEKIFADEEKECEF